MNARSLKTVAVLGSVALGAFLAGTWTSDVIGAPAPTIACGDLDASGTVAATDALLLLRRAVDLPVTLHCPCPDATTTTTFPAEPTTTTTQPVQT
jgi:hypothetical protein